MSIVSDEKTMGKSHAPGQRYTIILSCLHMLTFDDPAPKMGEELWCPRCRDYKRAAVAPPNYRLDCDKCSKIKEEFGSALITAETHAVKHSLKRAGHRVTLYNGATFVQEFFSEILQVDVDVAPF